MKTFSPFPIDIKNLAGKWLATYRFEPFLGKWFYIEPAMHGAIKLVDTKDVPSNVLDIADSADFTDINAYVAPIKLQVQLNTSCNFRCEMCYVSPELVGKKLSLDTLDSIFTIAKSCGVLRVNFVGGEIFMRRDIEEVFRCAQSHHLLTSCITNGIIPGAQPEKYYDLFQSMYAVQVSCNGIGESYDKEHGGVGWSRAKDYIKETVHMAPSSILSYVITSDNVSDIPGFIEYAESVNPSIIKFGTVCWSGKSSQKGALEYYSKTLTLARRLIQNARTTHPNLKIQSQIDDGRETPLWEDYIHGYRPYSFYFSPEGRDGLYVSAVGKYYPFPLLSDNPAFCLGTIQDDLLEIWKNNRILNNLRNVTFENSSCGKLGCTQPCGLWNRSYAIAWSGDIYGKVPCAKTQWK